MLRLRLHLLHLLRLHLLYLLRLLCADLRSTLHQLRYLCHEVVVLCYKRLYLVVLLVYRHFVRCGRFRQLRRLYRLHWLRLLWL